jgi:S-adenosylmethionine hydrolase
VNQSFKPCGVISVTTDFGHRGPFVGTMKGVIYNRFPGATVIDLTHEAYVHWPAEAGFWLQRSFSYFPMGSVHLAVVDPGVGTDRSVLIVLGRGHLFLAPDNGLLGDVIEAVDGTVIRVEQQALSGIALPSISATFHGRDVFAPMAAVLASGEVAPEALGVSTLDYVPSLIEPPEVRGAELHGVVITTDHFGNLITNIEADTIAQRGDAVIKVGGHDVPLRRTYGDVEPGELLALINSYGVLEIARAEQSAAELLGVGRGAPVIVSHKP